MIGDTFSGQIYWHDWLGGRDGGGHPRSCTGTVEHVGTGWVLIRRPRGGLRLKRLSRATLDGGRLCASSDVTNNIFRAWLEHDEEARYAKRARFAAAKVRHESDRAADSAHRAITSQIAADDTEDFSFPIFDDEPSY